MVDIGEALDSFISVSLIALLVFTALAFGTVEPWSLAIFELSVVLLLMLWAIKLVVDRQSNLLVPPSLWPLIALLILGLIQCVSLTGSAGKLWSLSLDVEATRLTVLTLFCLIGAFALFANFLFKRNRIVRLGYFLVVYGLAFSVFGLAQHFSWNGKFFWFIEPTFPLSAPFGSFVNHAHFSGHVEMLMSFGLAAVLLKSVHREARLFFGFASIVMSVATVISLSRGGMISMVVGLLFTLVMSMLILHRRRSVELSEASRTLLVSRFGIGTVVLAMIIGGIFWVGIDPVLNRIDKSKLAGEVAPGEQTLYSSRGVIWEKTLDLIRDYPVTGTGLGTFATVFAKYTVWDGAYLRLEQAHNDYLQILADAGLIGGVLAIWFLVSIARSFVIGIQHPDPALAALVLGAGGGIVALLVHSVFDFNLQIPANSLLFLLLSAMISVIGTPSSTLKWSKMPSPKMTHNEYE